MHPPYYRGCWHGVSRCLFLKYRQNFFLEKRGLQTKILHPSRGIAPSGFRPLRKIPHCCLPEESGPCLSPSVADHPLRPAIHLRLGRPLPHQLPNGPRAHPSVINLSQLPPRELTYPVLAPLSRRYPRLKGRLLTCYSPVRRFNKRPKSPFSLDLHVLSTPPTFVLSQDQTRQFYS